MLDEIGKGGFGVVWLAELLGEGGFQKEVAVKVLHHGQEDADIARRLRDEARILGLIRHPGVVQVDGLVRVEGRWAVVMELIDGPDLSRLLCEGALPPRVALEVAGEVARVLAAAWETRGPDGQPLRLIHRDIKPSNLKLTATGAVKVLDFGVARAEFSSREAVTTKGSFGTVGYMSPERLEWVDGHEGDVYALGVVLFEMLVGERLGRTSPRPERHEALLEAARGRLRPSLPDPDPGIEDLVLSLLAFDAGRRPSAHDVEERCDLLADAAGGEKLRRWAARTIRPRSDAPDAVPPARVTAMVELSGATFGPLSEDPPPHVPETPEERAEPIVSSTSAGQGAGRRGPLRLGPWLAGGLAAAGVVSVALWALGGPGTFPSEAEATAGGPETPTLAPPPPPDPSAAAAATPAQDLRAAPSAAPATPEPSPKATSSETPRSRDVPLGRVDVTVVGGDARVSLVPVAGGTARAPGALPEGTYAIRATFEDGSVVEAGTVRVESGRTQQLECNARFRNCKTR